MFTLTLINLPTSFDTIRLHLQINPSYAPNITLVNKYLHNEDDLHTYMIDHLPSLVTASA